jgi:hypothetical protein
MNKELIQQFLNRACYDEQDQRELEDWINVEKFTELIVRECAEICMKEFDTGLLMAPQAPWIAKQIKEHFGVEE